MRNDIQQSVEEFVAVLGEIQQNKGDFEEVIEQTIQTLSILDKPIKRMLQYQVDNLAMMVSRFEAQGFTRDQGIELTKTIIAALPSRK
jgi:hypothetical protein